MNKRELLDGAVFAMELRFEKCGVVMPMYHAVAGDGSQFLLPMPRLGTKDKAVAAVRAVFAAKRVTGYVFMDEAWMLNKKSDEITDAERDRMNREGVSWHPDRKEVLVFLAEDADGMLQGIREIIRPEGGKPTLGPLEVTQMSMEGRMVGLLPTPAGVRPS